jgi:pilus assembly protein CpaE
MINTDLNVACFFFDEEVGKEVERVFARVDGIAFSSRKIVSEDQLSQIGEEELPDIIVFELDGHTERHLEDIEKILRKHRDKVSIYVTYKEVDIGVVRRMMRAGVKDIFPQPLQAQEIVTEISHAISSKRERVKAAKGAKGGVTAFVNAKGGSGATTLAVNVAHVLATKFKAEVALIDLDLQFGDVALSLDIKPRTTIIDALRQPDRVDPVFLKALMTKHESGLDILASPGNLTSIEELTPQAVRKILQAAVEDYEFVILDVPRIFSSAVIEALKFSEPVMLVGQNSLETIRDAKVVLDNLSLIGLPLNNIELINNRAMAKSSSVPIDKLKDTLGKEKVHRIRNDFAASTSAQDQGLPVTAVANKSEMTKDVVALAEYLVKMHRGDEEKKKGFFAKLFRY